MNSLSIKTALTLLIAACAWGGPIPLGKYTVTTTSILLELDGVKWAVNVAMDGDYYFAKLLPQIPGDHDFEEWTWNDRTLVTKEHHLGKTGCHEIIYSATNDGGKYRINCRNREFNDCDQGIDARTYFSFIPTAEGFRFEVWGVSTPENQGGEATLRHTYTFTRVK